MSGTRLEDATIGMAEELLVQGEHDAYLTASVMAHLEAQGVSPEDMAVLFDPRSYGTDAGEPTHEHGHPLAA